MGWTALYSVLLIHGWSTFMVEQRQSSFCVIQEFIDFNSVFKGAIVLLLISIYGLSSVVLYLMWVTQSFFLHVQLFKKNVFKQDCCTFSTVDGWRSDRLFIFVSSRCVTQVTIQYSIWMI